MISKIKTPLIILVVFTAFFFIWKIFALPSTSVLIELIKEYFINYGIITVFVASIVEGMLLVGVYIPGGMVIFLGVLTSLGDPKRAILSIVMTILGLSLAYVFNYFLGKYGWYKIFVRFGLKQSLIEAQANLKAHHNRAIYISYWQPNFASFVSTASGVLGIDFKKFVFHSTLATIIWCAVWGCVAYFLGQKVLDYLGPVFLLVMIGWIIVICWKSYRAKEQN